MAAGRVRLRAPRHGCGAGSGSMFVTRPLMISLERSGTGFTGPV